MYSYVIRMSLVCTRISSVCHSYVLVCHPYVIRMWFYREPFSNASVDGKVAIFNRPILNIFNNFIPHEIILCNDRDPLWFNDEIKLLIKEKTTTYKYFRQIVTMLIGNIV